VHRRIFTSLAAAAAVVGSILITSPAASAADPAPTPALATTNTAPQSAGVTSNGNLPAGIQVPSGNKIVASLRGVGKQVYDCNSDGKGYTLREPVAGLFTSRGIPVAIHGKGPFWASFDGSHVDGTAKLGQADSPDPTKNVPWLLFQGSATGTGGVFSNVTFIQRLDTRGGVAPIGNCTPGQTVPVDYTANYVFWAKG
jgi:Protein of unknown function (DUF3455)